MRWLVGGLWVALGWLWGRNRLAINRLCSGFDVALMWLWVALARGPLSGVPTAVPRWRPGHTPALVRCGSRKPLWLRHLRLVFPRNHLQLRHFRSSFRLPESCIGIRWVSPHDKTVAPDRAAGPRNTRLGPRTLHPPSGEVRPSRWQAGLDFRCYFLKRHTLHFA